MSTADRDGKIGQKIADMHACLAMEINESIRDSSAEFEAVLDEVVRDVPAVWHDEAQRFAESGELDPPHRCRCDDCTRLAPPAEPGQAGDS